MYCHTISLHILPHYIPAYTATLYPSIYCHTISLHILPHYIPAYTATLYPSIYCHTISLHILPHYIPPYTATLYPCIYYRPPIHSPPRLTQLEYHSAGEIDDFVNILEGSREDANLQYDDFEKDQMIMLDTLAAHYVRLAHDHREKVGTLYLLHYHHHHHLHHHFHHHMHHHLHHHLHHHFHHYLNHYLNHHIHHHIHHYLNHHLQHNIHHHIHHHMHHIHHHHYYIQEKKRELFTMAMLLYTTADKIIMYDQVRWLPL